MKEVIERCEWLAYKCEDKAITPDVKDDISYLLEEIERLNNIIKDIKSQLDYLETYSSKEDVFEDMKRRLNRIDKIIGSDK